ncbi:uncharacterized protein LOC121136389 [Mesocricetus auratus]|uniref:Uncharacterized protein LOC121136389 n=1 Tax=Mesocricetus auratus TaxID=10036 RepID=A0ABM2WW37_MESAU|nr:uncharacterized protein LOC121136389 [Mesocricetus auratus]
MTAAPAPPRARPLPGRGGRRRGGFKGDLGRPAGWGAAGVVSPARSPLPSPAGKWGPTRERLAGRGRRQLSRAGRDERGAATGRPRRQEPDLAAGDSRCYTPIQPAVPSLCLGRLGFLGMGFDASHKSHCQGFPTDPVLCLGDSGCQGRPPWGLGEREAPCDNRPEEQGLAACEQGPQQVVFTVAKFRSPGPHLLRRRCPPCSASFSLGFASCAY